MTLSREVLALVSWLLRAQPDTTGGHGGAQSCWHPGGARSARVQARSGGQRLFGRQMPASLAVARQRKLVFAPGLSGGDFGFPNFL